MLDNLKSEHSKILSLLEILKSELQHKFEAVYIVQSIVRSLLVTPIGQ